ncbi:hypothetical protein SCP_0405750 [Sparassis crispa]|uniref:Uncharacterized protein n=1 Tax=Sparassis crispa TaxID=139825 RepID=A0A401GJ08_9APHY|nr:hypothetical protein SCP_0405750 [Sparassis crispa]GBE82194.1 hypothetical protein SCP_0405750 [Sparassis crispa]
MVPFTNSSAELTIAPAAKRGEWCYMLRRTYTHSHSTPAAEKRQWKSQEDNERRVVEFSIMAKIKVYKMVCTLTIVGRNIMRIVVVKWRSGTSSNHLVDSARDFSIG